MTTLLIESNRAIANSLISDNEEQTGIVDIRHKQIPNNANWSTTIDSGIELQPGDQISMEACALNVIGAGGGDFLQFNGTTDTSLKDGTFKSDNRCEIVVAYYVNNNGQFNCPLPKGSGTISDLNIQKQTGIISESFGSPDLTGKNIWGTDFKAQNFPVLSTTVANSLGNLNTEHPIGSTEDYKYYPCPVNVVATAPGKKAKRLAFWAFQNEWSMTRNGYFSKENNATTFSTPGVAAGSSVKKVQNTLDHFGFVSWCENTPQKGMPGVSFGQKNMSLDSTFNQNIENKDAAFNRVTTEANSTNNAPEIPGGAAPYLLQSTNFQNHTINKVQTILNIPIVYDGMYLAACFTTGGTFLPQNYQKFEADQYEDIVTYYPTTYKGSGFNHRPNNNRLYCSELYQNEKRNQGPYYREDTNNLITNHPVQTSNLLDFRTHGRDTKTFNFLNSTLDLDLGTGNLAPSRVAEIITDQMKERQPNMAQPNNEGISIGAEIFMTSPITTEGTLSGPFDESREPVLKKNIAQLTTKTYTTYPTLNGYCWNAKFSKPAGSVEGWDAIEKEQTSYNNDINIDLEEGNKYNVSQAYEKFYANMLVGNPYEWDTVCSIQPVLQACPMTFTNTSEANFNYENFSILAGFDDGINVSRSIPTNPPSKNTTTYRIGNLGNFPCLLGTHHPNALSANKQKSYICSWYAGNFVASASYGANAAAPVDPTLNYNIEALNCKNYQMYDTAVRRPILKVEDTNVFATNIIFDGQLQLSVFDEKMDKIKKHGNRFKPTSVNGDSLESQSIEFFNNTFVEWVMGRIDDQYSYPENESMNIPPAYDNPIIGSGHPTPENGIFESPPLPIKGREGTPIYLPNIFQTNRLFKGAAGLKTAGSPATDVNVSQEMKDVFCSLRRTVSTIPTSGSYMMRNMRVGYNENVHTEYNPNSNPQTIFNKGNSAGAYNPTTNNVNPGGTADRFFGIPSWTTYSDDFKQTGNELKSAYQKGCRRSIEAYRYLPQNKNVEYDVYSAFNKTIPLGSGAESVFTTCPETYTFERLKKLWDKITVLNKGKGIGIIPIFYKSLAVALPINSPGLLTATKDDLKILEIPFCGIIAQGQSYENIPVPEQGEYIMLGSTSSLSQNDLHHPFTTQQSNFQPPNEGFSEPLSTDNQYITNYCGIQSFKAITDAIPISLYGGLNNTGKYVPSRAETATRIVASEGKSISNIIYVGSNDPIMNYDTTFNRFALGNLHTQLFKGNGVFQLGSFGPDAAPDTIERISKGRNSAISQQVELPAGYFQKFDDTRIQGSPAATNEWLLFTLCRTTPPTVTDFGRDRYCPGRVIGGTQGPTTGLNLGPRGLQPLMTNSIEGNVIRQTFDETVYGPGTNEPQAVPLKPGGTGSGTDTSRKLGDIYFNNMEPGGLQMFIDATKTATNDQGFLGSVLPFVPFNATQFTLRCLNQESIVDAKIKPNERYFSPENLLGPTLRPYAYVQQDSKPYVYNSAQAGIGIIGYNVVKSNGLEKLTLTNTDYSLFEGSMLFKMGYELNQVLPLFSQVQTQYDHTLYNKFSGSNKSAFQAFNNMISPVTTNAINGSSGVPSTVGGFGLGSSDSNTNAPNTLMPMFNLGGLWASGAVTGNSDVLLAQRLPTRLSFPYLVLRSNIATPCASQYIGGANGSQLLPAVSYLMTSYASDDYFYASRSDLVFTVTKPYVLTEITSSIHFPNGRLATDILGLNTAVIYRIDFVPRVPEEPEDEKQNKKK